MSTTAGQRVVVAARWCRERIDNILTVDEDGRGRRNSAWHDQARHVRGMCDRIEVEVLPQGDVDRANRWLGFIQGWLYANGFATIDEMREVNRL